MEAAEAVGLKLHTLLASEEIHAETREKLRNINLLRQEKNKTNRKLDAVNKALSVLKREGGKKRWDEILLLQEQKTNLSRQKTALKKELDSIDPEVEEKFRVEYRQLTAVNDQMDSELREMIAGYRVCRVTTLRELERLRKIGMRVSPILDEHQVNLMQVATLRDCTSAWLIAPP